ncbi:peptidylprolyl isomerase [Nocardioides sp.]|uniref:peptidylprolyl isomerase n=1 Tax=Nocardioides sp. TaxID=35761 RepID=UPI00273250DE|nr:peptidylprolyl isomerase [Nocardioides sp.]MDP3894230.1 peptidylprolyl isomerase [Nocardioides sp.]
MSRRTRPFAPAVAALAALLVLAACGGDEETEPAETATSPTETSETTKDSEGAAPCTYTESTAGEVPLQVEVPEGEPTVSGEVAVTMETSAGTIPLTLDAAAAPCTVESFVSLAEQDYFDDTVCHRLTDIPGFGVLQCGDPAGTGFGGPGYTIPDELTGSETYTAGTVAMANTGSPDSGGSQFFLVYADTELPPQYTVFGQVGDAGLAVLEDIAATGVVDGGQDGEPAEPVEVLEVSVD